MVKERKCDRCWKPTPVDELISVPNKEWILHFCKECAEITGNKPKGD